MRTAHLIHRKRDSEELNPEEIASLVEGYARGDVPDFQMAAFLMATYFAGMSDREVSALTDCLVRSGETLDLSAIPGHKVDKHSTGGVGDKISLILVPLSSMIWQPCRQMRESPLGQASEMVLARMNLPGLAMMLLQLIID